MRAAFGFSEHKPIDIYSLSQSKTVLIWRDSGWWWSVPLWQAPKRLDVQTYVQPLAIRPAPFEPFRSPSPMIIEALVWPHHRSNMIHNSLLPLFWMKYWSVRHIFSAKESLTLQPDWFAASVIEDARSHIFTNENFLPECLHHYEPRRCRDCRVPFFSLDIAGSNTGRADTAQKIVPFTGCYAGDSGSSTFFKRKFSIRDGGIGEQPSSSAAGARTATPTQDLNSMTWNPDECKVRIKGTNR